MMNWLTNRKDIKKNDRKKDFQPTLEQNNQTYNLRVVYALL